MHLLTCTSEYRVQGHLCGGPCMVALVHTYVVVWARADVWWCLLLVVCVLGVVKEIGKYEGK